MSDSDIRITSDEGSTYVAGEAEGLPFCVRREVFDGRAPRTRADLDDLPQGWVADEPIHLTLTPAVARAAYLAMGAKEGHGTTRTGVTLPALAPPRRRSRSEVPRRPVVALLDTVVQAHDWIGDGSGDDPFWRDARDVPGGWNPTGPDGTALEVPGAALTPLDRCAGHGTFITGIIRQLAPDATVLSLPVMHADGSADEKLVPSALAWLLERAREASTGRPELAIDVVNLSWGRYLGADRVVDPDDADRRLLDELGALGVRVIASAGNRATALPVPPAAWSAATDAEHTALKGVGALDADGRAAPYSNHGPHVRAWAPGSAVVSTLPRFDPVSPPDPAVLPDVEKVTEDPNLQRSTFGRWGGTSFAAAWVSARVAATLLDDRVAGDLRDTTTSATTARAARVWEHLADEFAPPDPGA